MPQTNLQITYLGMITKAMTNAKNFEEDAKYFAVPGNTEVGGRGSHSHKKNMPRLLFGEKQ